MYLIAPTQTKMFSNVMFSSQYWSDLNNNLVPEKIVIKDGIEIGNLGV